jgi:hypothetical protein
MEDAIKTNDLIHYINECERLALETGEPHFVLSWKTLHEIKKKSMADKDDRRDADLEEILDEEEYTVGDWHTVLQMPSMTIYYDSVSKLTEQKDRITWAINRLEKLGFQKNSIFDLIDEEDRGVLKTNYNMEFTMKFELEYGDFISATISPNLLSKIKQFSTTKSDKTTIGHEMIFREIYHGYLITEDIIEAIADNVKAESMKPIVRDLKINELLD